MSDADFTELRELARDLGNVPADIGPRLVKVMDEDAEKVEKDAKATAKTSRNRGIRRAASAITHDLHGGASLYGSGSLIEAEVGYRKGRPGSLGNIREFGVPGTAGHHDLAKSLAENAQTIVRDLADAVEDAEKANGL